MSKRNPYFEIATMLSLLTQVGLMIIIPILGCMFIGKFIDSKLNTSPIFLLIFILLGIGGAFMSVYKTLSVYAKRK
ncbi:AtpZ/AtpI family protein [Faecalimicrobium sp. JNUCC 81]